MGRKKPAEEHENLERWLVSYADFMTLLFATFVVLYALAQSDVNSFKGIEEALRKAFSQNIFDNQESIMDGQNSILEGQQGATNPLMLEYMSQKYEQSSYEEIKEDIDKLKEDGISAEIDEKGLVIRFSEHALQFESGTAELTQKSKEKLAIVANIIKQKFSIHYIQVEGHTDSNPISNKAKYPSNWELSTARACSVVRFLIYNNNFNPKLFNAVGYADTVPIASNSTPENRAKNRRVEIVILKNKFKNLSDKNMQEILKDAKILQKKEQLNKNNPPSEAIENLIGNDKELLNNVIDISGRYENENKRLENLQKDTYTQDSKKPEFME